MLKSQQVLLDEIAPEVEEIKEFIQTQNERIKSMHDVLTELREYKVVLEKCNEIIHGLRLDE